MTKADVMHAYCTSCGAPMVHGRCSGTCPAATGPSRAPAATAQSDPAPGTRLERRGRILAVVALVTALVVGGVALALLTVTQARLNDATADLGDTREQVNTLGRQLEAAQTEQQAAAARLHKLESAVNGQPDIPRTAKAASRSVFTIEVADGSGSGFAVRNDAGGTVLVTNFHVVARTYLNGDRQVDVRGPNTTYTGTITDASESNDLAVISVPDRLPVLEVVNRRPAIGAPVLALVSAYYLMCRSAYGLTCRSVSAS